MVSTDEGNKPKSGTPTNQERDTKMKKSEAVILRAGRPVALTETAAKNGDVVYYGWDTVNDGMALHSVGRGKISRAKKWLGDKELMYALEMKGYAFVNFGGGAPL